MRPIPLLLAFAMVGGALLAAPVPKEIARANDNARILGSWKQEKISLRGGGEEGGANTTFRFGADGSCGIAHGDRENPAWYTLDSAGSPRRMKWLNGPEKTEWRCFYELDGDKLKVCFFDPKAELPAKLEPGPTATIYYLTRVQE